MANSLASTAKQRWPGPTWRSLEPAAWLVPAVAALALAWTQVGDRNLRLFLAINDLAAILPAALWSCVTTLGDTLVALVILLPLLRLRPRNATAALIAAIPAGWLGHLAKNWLDADRPARVLGSAVHIIGPTLKQGSFPSGHTTTAFVLAAVVAAGFRSRVLAMAVIAAAVLVGVSRVAVGAHWPGDAAAGALLGWLSGLLGVWLVRRYSLDLRPWQRTVFSLVLAGCALWLLTGYDSRYPLARPFLRWLAAGALVLGLLPGWRWRGRSPHAAPSTLTAPQPDLARRRRGQQLNVAPGSRDIAPPPGD